MNKVNITIPEPCHENWEAMTSVEKGKFCNSCQKKVFDFTSSSDREIINAFQKDNNLCGRFLNTQLNRDLVKPKEKSTLWLATTTALISLIGVNEATSQEKAPTEQTGTKIVGKPAAPIIANQEIEVSGVVSDEQKLPLPGATISIKGTNKTTQTDFDGKFTIKAKIDDWITVSFIGLEDLEFKVNSSKTNNIILKESISYEKGKVTPTMLGYIKVIKRNEIKQEPAKTIIENQKKRTFFGRLFHKK